GDVGRIAAAAEEVIGASERDEAFRMLRCGEDAARIVDADDLVGRRVEDQQCLAQVGNAIEELMLGEVVDEIAADAKLPTREGRLDLTLGADLVETILEQAGHVGGIAGCGDRHHRARLRHLGGGGEHRGAAEAVADEDRGRGGAAAQLVRGRDQVGDIGGECGVGEFAFARAEAGEVEAQHGDAERGQAFGNTPGGVDILAASKAGRKQRVGARLLGGAVEQRGKLLSVGVGKLEALSRHALLRSTAGASPRVSMSSSSLYLDLVVVRADRVGVPPASSTPRGLTSRTGARWAILTSSSPPCLPPLHFPALARSSVQEVAREMSLTSPLTSPTLM